MLGDSGGPDLELGGEPFAQRGGQVGHLVEAGGPFLEEPFPHLSRPIRRQPMLDEPVAKSGGSLFEDGVITFGVTFTLPRVSGTRRVPLFAGLSNTSGTRRVPHHTATW